MMYLYGFAILAVLAGIGTLATAGDTDECECKVEPGATVGKSRRVEFKSDGFKLVGLLFVPPSYKEGTKLPALILMTPAGGIKEQTVSNYAKKMCCEGFVSLVYDHRTFGESEGRPRGFEHPGTKLYDAGNAITFLQTSVPEVDPSRLGALGICMGGAYLTVIGIQDKRIKAVATVSAMMNPGDKLGSAPPEMLAQLLAASNNAREQYAANGTELNAPVIAHDIDENSEQLEREVYDYYRTSRAGEATFPTYTPNMFLGTVQEVLIWNVIPMAKKMGDTPYLGVVGSKAQTRQQTELAYAEMPGPKKELFVVEGATHVSLYDTPDQVCFVSKKVASFFRKYL